MFSQIPRVVPHVARAAVAAAAAYGVFAGARDLSAAQRARGPAESGVDTPAGRLGVESHPPSAQARAWHDRPAGDRPVVLGVLGGMGPEATVELMQQIYVADKEMNQPTRDQEFKPYVALMKSDIPDRTAFLMRRPGAEDPVPKMKEGIDELANARVTHFAMPCNTAHVFLPELEAHIQQKGMSVVHIVDATMAEVDKRAAGAKKVAVMATDGTLGSELYQTRGDEYRQRNGQDPVGWLVPSGSQAAPDSDQGKVMRAIYGCVKNAAGPEDRMQTAEALFTDVARRLADDGADAILLACTEIPIALRGKEIRATDGRTVPLISTTEALANAFIRTAQEGGVPVAASPATLQASGRAVEAHVPHGA